MEEAKYYGIHACLRLFEVRKEDVIRVYLHESNLKSFSFVLKWCSKNKKAYHLVSNEELERISDSVHHEGVCFLAKRKEPLLWKQAEPLILSLNKVCLLYLDGVQNPHNIGSIVRSAAHFGVSYLLMEKATALAPSAYRIAQGGGDSVHLVSVSKSVETLKSLKNKGFSVVTTSSHGGEPLYGYPFSERSLIIMGSETEGVSKALFDLAGSKVQIPGTGKIESLNVSVATALCISEYARKFC